MLKRLGIDDLIKGVIEKVESKTGIRCYDEVPKDAVAPFFFAEFTGREEQNTKMAFRDHYTVAVHAIAPVGVGNVAIYNLIKQLEEALTESIDIPDGFYLVDQRSNGILALKEDETKEKHAVLSFEFVIIYAFAMK